MTCLSVLGRERPAAISIEIKSIDDTSNFDEFPDSDILKPTGNPQAVIPLPAVGVEELLILWEYLSVLSGSGVSSNPCSDLELAKQLQNCSFATYRLKVR